MRFILFSLFLILLACNNDNKALSAEEIIDKTIKNAGGEIYENATIEFSFRNLKYTSKRKNGSYELTRNLTDSLGKIRDVLNNSGFERFRNGEKNKFG